MNRTCTISIVIAMTMALLLPATMGKGEAKAQSQRAPVLTQVAAATSVGLGQSWRIFLAGRDGDGDMRYLVTEIYQPGVGYAVDLTYLPPTKAGRFSGYIFLRTPAADWELVGEKIQVTVFVRDGRGNASRTATLPLRFDLIGKPQDLPSWAGADTGRLGAVWIDVQSPGRTNRQR